MLSAGPALELGLAGAAVLGLDQATKSLAIRALAGGRVVPAWRWSPVRLRLVLNRRPGLGLPLGDRALVAVWLVLAVGIVLLAHTTLGHHVVARVGLGAALGGAAGNLVDRLRRGAVTDFVDLRAWPVFNVADVGIVGGCLAALWALARP